MTVTSNSIVSFIRLAHLGEEERFETTGFMRWVERVLPQIAWIDTGFFCTRDSAQHGASISFGHCHSKQARFVITARDVTDMYALAAVPAQIVQETMAPEIVHLWLRHESPQQKNDGGGR